MRKEKTVDFVSNLDFFNLLSPEVNTLMFMPQMTFPNVIIYIVNYKCHD